MDQRRKLAALKARLGEPREQVKRKGEYGFLCPKPDCDSRRKDKGKLFVNLEKDWFNCWVCGYKGRNLGKLMVPDSAEQKEYIEALPSTSKRQASVDTSPRCYQLPEGYKPLHRNAPLEAAPYRQYIRSRNISDDTVALYRIGYIDAGPLAGRVVVPSFDEQGEVNFYSARTIHKDVRPAYILPEASKDIISNEYMVDWTQPVYIVEGIFDEIAVGPQAIALYGKYLPMALIMKLMKEQPPLVYVCLDNDARREGLNMVERLVSYDIKSALVDIPGKDAGSVGGKIVIETSMASRPVTGSAGMVATRGNL